MTELGLPGFQPENLLAFLGLIGLLRAVEAARPAWRTRVTWSGPPWQAAVRASTSLNEEVLTDAVADGLRALAPSYQFGNKADVDWSAAEFREYAHPVLQEGRRERADLLSALASDGAARRDSGGQDGKLMATALCTMFGQGHQHFLGQLAHLSDIADASTIRDDITAALFKPWRYEERKEALKFRWDPVEDRRYAYRYSNPSGQVVTTVPGANVLGALGFPLFVVAPRGQDLGTLAFGRSDRERFVTWPIWIGPWSLASIRALLTHPEILSPAPKRSELVPYGVVELMRSIRIQTDKYFNFGPALPLWGTRQAPSSAKDDLLYAAQGEAEGQSQW
jgi:hypothetical protein